MEGIELSALSEDLYPVDEAHKKESALPILATITKNTLACGLFEEEDFKYLRHSPDSVEFYNQLPINAFVHVSFDELCKLRSSSMFSMHESVEKWFGAVGQYELVRKIKSSLWRWSYFDGDWNQVVSAYNAIRNFSLELSDDFELRLDFTTGYNERGYSKFSRTFFDGVFGFLLYYKGKHVMTIGFSILKDRQVVITQFQTTEQRGNRFLYKLPTKPEDFLDYVVTQFKVAFVDYRVGVADGSSLVRRVLEDYFRSRRSNQRMLDDALRYHKRERDKKMRKAIRKSTLRHTETLKKIDACIAHIVKDAPRLRAQYGRLPNHRVVGEIKAQGIAFKLLTST